MQVDLNTLLIGIVLALSSWTLYTVHGLAVNVATEVEKNKAQDDALAEDRARIIEVEEDVADLQVKMATLEERTKT